MCAALILPKDGAAVEAFSTGFFPAPPWTPRDSSTPQASSVHLPEAIAEGPGYEQRDRNRWRRAK
jgi:hypothetical protein